MVIIFIDLNTFSCSGKSRGGAWRATPPPLFLDQTEAQRAEKNFLETAPPRLSQGLDPALSCHYVLILLGEN